MKEDSVADAAARMALVHVEVDNARLLRLLRTTAEYRRLAALVADSGPGGAHFCGEEPLDADAAAAAAVSAGAGARAAAAAPPHSPPGPPGGSSSFSGEPRGGDRSRSPGEMILDATGDPDLARDWTNTHAYAAAAGGLSGSAGGADAGGSSSGAGGNSSFRSSHRAFDASSISPWTEARQQLDATAASCSSLSSSSHHHVSAFPPPSGGSNAFASEFRFWLPRRVMAAADTLGRTLPRGARASLHNLLRLASAAYHARSQKEVERLRKAAREATAAAARKAQHGVPRDAAQAAATISALRRALAESRRELKQKA